MRSIIVLPLQHVFYLISLLSLCIFSVSSAFGSPALPGCDDMCGNVTIPYPFGIGTGCHMNEWFSVTCDTSFYPSKPFLSYHKAEVVEILLNGTLRISSKMSSDCIFHEYGSMNLGDNPYFLYSERGNRFTALGCGVQASISENNELIGGCISICNNESRSSITRNGDGCYGIDCCQAMIPYGLKNFTLEVRGTRRDGVYETCKFAFLADKDWIFSQSFPYPFSGIPPEVPVVIDWKFSAQETCGICGPNTVCKTDNQGFNSCLCDAGFEGNPYLPHGCSDVDECADPLLNRCVKNCINKPGNYSCSCPSGYHGDGQKDGSGCILNKSWVKPTLIGTSAGLGVLFIIFGALWSYKVLQRRKIIKLKEKFFKRNGGLLLQQKLSSNEGSVEKTKLFTSTELEIATDRYNENRILGRGGQGTVYKGMLTDGRIVAVKMSTVIDEGQIEQFINEVVILSQIDHRNVVKLLGCCLETEVPLLVYEFIPNGTLSHVIEDQTEEFPMSWEMRLRVAAEVASAIAYLHSAASVLIYHRDIKSSNILLDEKFRAKLSDFGTSKSVALDQTHLTTQVKGTFGYLDPEYFRSSQFTEKSDVYSFGVVLVELLTGLKPICSVGTQEKISLVAYFISSLEENRLFDILDARVVKEDLKEELMAVAYLAKRCLDLNGRNRPSMKEVAMELEGIMISKGYLFTQQKQVEVEVKESTEIIKLSSTSSAGTYSDIKSPSTLDVQQLMFYTM